MVDPVGAIPVFLALTPTFVPNERRRIAWRAVLVAFVIMVIFAAIGRPLLRVLRISIAAFQIAGGVLLFLIAVDMLFARRSGARETPEEEADALARQDVSVFPIAIPMISGPGTVTATVLLISRAEGDLVRMAMVGGAILITAVAALFVLLSAEPLRRLLGVTGINALTRVMGILLSALAVQMILDGIRAARIIL